MLLVLVDAAVVSVLAAVAAVALVTGGGGELQ